MHPSLIKGKGKAKEGFSLFMIFEKFACTKNGKKKLKQIFFTPTYNKEIILQTSVHDKSLLTIKEEDEEKEEDKNKDEENASKQNYFTEDENEDEDEDEEEITEEGNQKLIKEYGLNQDYKYSFQLKDALLFKCDICVDLDLQYGDIQSKIIDIQREILREIEFEIIQNKDELNHINEFLGELDVFLLFFQAVKHTIYENQKQAKIHVSFQWNVEIYQQSQQQMKKKNMQETILLYIIMQINMMKKHFLFKFQIKLFQIKLHFQLVQIIQEKVLFQKLIKRQAFVAIQLIQDALFLVDFPKLDFWMEFIVKVIWQVLFFLLQGKVRMN
ncbi:hypothetical protein IMG5_055310 [Ichthyophthirius multifiliis]|uniref:Uncharacterized protein n=1 Tax=Ichthyophthirius multifiliis TaxID=5932 RepID=G0QN50_ICHMU|nr:hypothetical protein IMG5_055310 [Ichthyophthirius multifiliis]EGR33352.1 hypothetical protein IMG5_055310 [Ichthyophthirius multifiliis]|eukprot:XP_004037338.1 hypothetical protein IMG5_055310 [Ichthyophthirius multifiliis]